MNNSVKSATDLEERAEAYHPAPHNQYAKFDQSTGEQVHDDYGRELPDPVPMAPPVGYTRQPSLSEQIRAMVVSEQLRAAAMAAGEETFEEADDFDIGDEFDQDRHSPYEADFDPMTPEERAALSTQGRDADRILTKEEKSSLSSKAKKNKASGDQPDPGIGSDSDDLAGEAGAL